MNTNNLDKLPTFMTKEDFVYSRIGMALISAQRVEFLTGKLLEHLVEFDKEVYGITTLEFLEKSTKSKTAFKTLGAVFTLLKLNPKLVVEDELNSYLIKRNLFVHNFWAKFLTSKADEKVKVAIEFCNDFGRHSDKISSFFQGFLFFLALRGVKDRNELDPSVKSWDVDFDFFIDSLKHKSLNQT